MPAHDTRPAMPQSVARAAALPIPAPMATGPSLEQVEATKPGQAVPPGQAAFMKSGVRPEGGTQPGPLGDVAISALKGAIGLPEAAVGLADLVTGGRAGQAAEAVGFQPGLAKQILDRGLSTRQQTANQAVEAADGPLATAIAALSNPSTILMSAVESAPLMVGGAGLARGVIGAGLGALPAAAIGEGAITAGSAAEQIRQQSPDGRLTAGQSALAATSGVLTGALGILGGKIAKSLGIADVDTMLAGAAADPTAQQGLVKRIIWGAVTEGGLEELPQSVQEQVLQNKATGRPWDEGVDHAAVMGALVGAVMGGGTNVVEGLAPMAPMPAHEPGVVPVTPPPTPEPPVAAAPTPGPPPPARPSAPAPAAAPGITRPPDELDRALAEGRGTVGRPSALPPPDIWAQVDAVVDDSGRNVLGDKGYAGPERRGTDRVLTDAEDAAQTLYRERLARGEDVRSPQQIRQFEERQRVENYRAQAEIEDVQRMEPKGSVPIHKLRQGDVIAFGEDSPLRRAVLLERPALEDYPELEVSSVTPHAGGGVSIAFEGLDPVHFAAGKSAAAAQGTAASADLPVSVLQTRAKPFKKAAPPAAGSVWRDIDNELAKPAYTPTTLDPEEDTRYKALIKKERKGQLSEAEQADFKALTARSTEDAYLGYLMSMDDERLRAALKGNRSPENKTRKLGLPVIARQEQQILYVMRERGIDPEASTPASGSVMDLIPALSPPPGAGERGKKKFTDTPVARAKKETEKPPVTAPPAHVSTFTSGDRVRADEGTGTVHTFDGATRNVKIALEPDGRLTKWIPADRVTLAPQATAQRRDDDVSSLSDEELAARIIAKVEGKKSSVEHKESSAAPDVKVGDTVVLKGSDTSTAVRYLVGAIDGDRVRLREHGMSGTAFTSSTALANVTRVEAPPDTPVTPASSKGITVTYNSERSSIEVKFAKKPSTEVLEKLKAKGFRWAKGNKVWYHKNPAKLTSEAGTVAYVTAFALAKVRAMVGLPTDAASLPMTGYTEKGPGGTLPVTAPKAAAETRDPDAAIPVKDKPRGQALDWTEIGKNAIGQTLYQDQRGVRSYIENGERHIESVRLQPTRGGMLFSVDRSGDNATVWKEAGAPGTPPVTAPTAAAEPTGDAWGHAATMSPGAEMDWWANVIAQDGPVRARAKGHGEGLVTRVEQGVSQRVVVFHPDGLKPLVRFGAGQVEPQWRDGQLVAERKKKPETSQPPVTKPKAPAQQFKKGDKVEFQDYDGQWYETEVTSDTAEDGQTGIYHPKLQMQSMWPPGAQPSRMRVSVEPGKLRPVQAKPVTPQVEPTWKAELPDFVTKPHAKGVAAKKAENKAKRDALIAQLKKDLGSDLTTGIDPKHVVTMVKIARTYLDDGLLTFEAATLQFRDEYGEPFLRKLAEHWEAGWEVLQKEEGSVDAVLARGSTPALSITPLKLEGEMAGIQQRAIEALQADPEGFARRYREQFGNVLNADNASELFEEYRQDRARRVQAVRAPAGALVDYLFREGLADPDISAVLFTAGGNASGKSSGIPDAGDRDGVLVMDSTFSSQEPSFAKVDAALDAGHPVSIRYVFRAPEEALAASLTRARDTTRTVTLRGLIHTHMGSRRTVLEASERYPDVEITVRENTAGGPVARDLAWLREEEYDDVDVLLPALRSALDAEYDAGRISDAIYEGTLGRELRHTDGTARGRGADAEREGGPSVPTRKDGRQGVSSDGPEQSGDSDRGALAGVPAEDGEGAGADRPAAGSTRSGRGTDADSGVPGGAGRDDAGHGAGTVPGRVGVSPKRGGRAGARKPRTAVRAGKAGLDYTITAADHVGEGGPVAKTEANIAAIKTLKQIEAEGRKATAAEQAILVKYVGWGGLSNIFGRDSYSANGKILKDILTDEEYASARASTPNAHYTSPEVVSAMYDAVARLGVKGGRVLEPAMGVGHFFGLMPKALAGNTTWAGVELDSITARIAQQLYQSAQIQATGFEKAALPPGFFRLLIGNPPFGNYPIHDPTFRGRPNALTGAIHNYFFAKALDLVEDGGIVAFITSHYTMDAKDSTVRTYLAGKARLLGAIRLPNTAFKANAGTEVVTDIIFLQKGGTSNAKEWTGTGPLGDNPVNDYFLANPRMVLGRHAETGSMHSENEYTVEPTGDLTEQLAAAVKLLPKNVMAEPKAPKTIETDPDEFVPAPDYVKPFAFTEQDGKLMMREGARLVSMDKLPKETKRRIRGMMRVRTALRETMRTMLNVDATDAQIEAAQATLNTVYDKFVDSFGFLHEMGNFRAFGDDPDKPLLLSLEDWDPAEGTAEKADIFTKRTLAPAKPVTHVDTPGAALILSLNVSGKVDWDYMARVTGQTPTELQEALAGQVFEEPGGGWSVADAYLSGDVKQKLEDAQAAAALDGKFRANVEALQKVQPEDLGPGDVHARLGANWIPARDVEAFVDSLLEVQNRITVKYIPALSAWVLDGAKDVVHLTNNTAKWGTARAPAMRLVEDALNGKFTSVYDETDDGGRVLNSQETTAARAKQAELHAAFSAWIWSDETRAARLLKHYNRHFNNLVMRSYNGEHLSLTGQATEVKLRPHQKNAIWRTLQTPNTLLAHVVGAGKTFVMIGSAMEKRRLGLARKPILVVPNHLVAQTAKEFLRMYPAANVLMTTKKDFEADHRKRLMARIATGDWDAVIVAHSSFKKVPVSDERFYAFLQREIDELEEAIRQQKAELGKGEHKRDKTIKEIEKAKKRLTAKLEKRRKADKQDRTVTWEELGGDALYVDEAHLFKNLFFATRMTRIAGLPNTESDRAFDMLLKIRHIQEVNNGGGVTFATGTPISNTMAEMYTMQRYLDPQGLESRGVSRFDAWAANFGSQVTTLEMTPEGKGFRMRTSFSEFVNWPDLAKMYRRFADVLTADKLNLPTPKVATGASQPVVSPSSENLKRYIDQLLVRAEKVRGGQVDPKDDNMLKIVGEGRKAALDLRLLGFDEPGPDGKLAKATDSIVDTYHEWNERKGTQLVFADIGTPKDASRKRTKKETAADEVEHVGANGFSPYDELKRLLIARGIPENEIKFIHDAKTDVQKQRLFDDMNAGRVRVLIGSTEKMGAGMNVQQRLVALHHLDAPWRPSDVEQREGRIVRQGNDFYKADPTGFEVNIFTYITEGSFDGYMWQTLERKARFIATTTSDNISARRIEDLGAMVLTASEMKAASSGDPRVFEKVKVDTEVQRLQILKGSHADAHWRLQRDVANLPTTIAQMERRLGELQRITSGITPETGEFSMTVGDETFTEPGKAGAAIRAAAWPIFLEGRQKGREPIATFRGLTVNVQTKDGGPLFAKIKDAQTGKISEEIRDDAWLSFEHQGIVVDATSFNRGPGEEGVTDALDVGLMQRVRNALERLTEAPAEHETMIAAKEKQLAQAEIEAAKPFEHEAKLRGLLAQQAILDKALNVDAQSRAAEAPAGDTDAEEDEDGSSDEDDDSEVAEMPGWRTNRPMPRPRGVPVTPTASQRPSDVVKALKEGFGKLPITTGHFRHRAAGIFKPDAQTVRVRVANDLQTIFHEVGHYLDHVVLGISRKDKRWRDELKDLGQATSRPSYTLAKQRKEGAAEFLREYFLDPNEARRLAPNYFAAFEAALGNHPETAAVVRDVQQRVQGYLSQDLATRGAMRIDRTGGDTSLVGAVRGAITAPKATAKALVRGMARQWIDDLDAIKQAVEEMRDGGVLPYIKNAYVLARNARGSASKAEGFLSVGVRGRSGKFMGPSLSDALAGVRSHLDVFGQYLVALRVLELDQRQIETGITDAEARAMIRKVEARADFADFEAARDKVYAYQDALLEYLRQYGALNDTQIKAIKKLNQFYVPFHRSTDDGGAEGRPGRARMYANRRTPISRIRGSGLDIINPFESIVKNTFAIVDMVEKNTAMLALTEQAERSAGSGKWLEKVDPLQAQKVLVGQALDLLDPDARDLLEAQGLDVDQLVTIFTPRLDPKASERMVTVIRNGKPQVWQVHDQALYDALVGMGPRTTSMMLEFAGFFTSLLRAGATLTPGFMARNPIRDTLVAYLQSRHGFIPVLDTAKGIVSLVNNDADAQLFWTSGVAQAALTGADADRTRARKAIRALTTQGRRAFAKNIVQHPIELLQAISALMESGSRLGEFRLALEAGGTERGIFQRLTEGSQRHVNEESLTRATLAARDVTTDFSRGGHTTRDLNRLYAFFNAGVQGNVRMVETIKRDPVGTALKVGSLVGVSYLLWLLNHDEDDPELAQRYENLPGWERNSYWHIPFGKTWIKVAKPFEWGTVANLVESYLDFQKKRDVDRDRHASKAFERVSPDRGTAVNLGYKVLPQFLLPITEAMFNYASFRDTHIVRPWDEDKDPELQYSDWTTETSKNLGKVMGVSPAKLDHLIFGYTAGVGRGVVEHGLDPVQRLLGLAPTKTPPKKPMRQLPLVGTFVREQAYDGTAQDLDDFYEEWEKLQGYDDSMADYQKAGDRARYTARLAEAKGEIYGTRRAELKQAQADLKALRQDINAVYKAPNRTPEEKRVRLDELYREMVDAARAGLGRPPLSGRRAQVPVTTGR